MANENEIVTLNIEIRDAAVTQTGFGVPMIAATHSFWSEQIRTFSDLTELTAAPINMPTTSDIYRAASKLKAQRPSVQTFKIGKLGATDRAADLNALRALDDDWYVLLTPGANKAAILDVAAWAEAQRLLYFPLSADTDLLNGVTGDVGSALQTAAYKRTALFYHHDLPQQASAGWVGRVLPQTIGSATWANWALAGVDRSPLTAAQRQTLTARNTNYYLPIKGIGFTLHGRTASGRSIDIVQGMDWFDVRTQERVIGLFANSPKIPYTDKGIELLRSQVEAQVVEGIGVGIVDGDQPWAVTAPLVGEIDANSKIARRLPRVRFNFVLQGAIESVEIAGTVNVAL